MNKLQSRPASGRRIDTPGTSVVVGFADESGERGHEHSKSSFATEYPMRHTVHRTTYQTNAVAPRMA